MTAPPAAPRARVVHETAGRVRFCHPGLLLREALARRTAATLEQECGIRRVTVQPLTGSVVIEYRGPATVAGLGRILDEAVGRGGLVRPPSGHAPGGPEAPHAASSAEVVARVGTHAGTGLPPDVAAARLAALGRNDLPRGEPRSSLAIFAEQLTSLPIALLAGSACLSLATGGLADAVMIAAVVLVNAGIATVTERDADRVILGLMEPAALAATVIRGGARLTVDAGELTVGDLLVIERGTIVAADARLVEAEELSVNEAPLTGEAQPARKDARLVLRPETGVPDRGNMVFRGTAVTGGSGAGVVTAVGRRTEIGRVQELLGSVRPPETPIQRELGEVGRELVLINGAMCATVLALGLLRGHPLLQVVRGAISLAVAAIPEGLPAVATTTLALGVKDMRRRGVIVRTIDAVETLGAVEVVGLDKTGTLTENRMAVIAVHADGTRLGLHEGRLLCRDEPAAPGTRAVVRRLFEAATLCSDAEVHREADGLSIEGTPTERALVAAGVELGIDPPALRAGASIVARAARGDGRKRMSTLHAGPDGGRLLCVKGDPAEVLARTSRRLTARGVVPLEAADREAILRANDRMAADALRVLGVACDEAGGDPRAERDLVWLGLAGMANPIRPSARPALRRLHRAGVRTVMITGDQSATAHAIARRLELGAGDELRVLEAGAFANLDPDLLAALAARPDVFARVSPVDKLNIVKALQAGGRVVAMTGDGVNDGPALRAADVGIAMGGDGSDLARQVADVVLSHDDMDGIIEAIRLGRATHANIRKVLRYLVSTNASETLAMLGAAILDAGEPLAPMQLLWLNLVTDSLPALALGLEPPEPDVLESPPHDSRAPILGAADFRRTMREGAILGAAALAGYFAAGGRAGGARAGCVAFHGLTLGQLLHAIACRSQTGGLSRELGRKANRRLRAGIAGSLLVQGLVQVLPAARRFLGLVPLRSVDLATIAAIGLGSSLVNEAVTGALAAAGARWRPGGAGGSHDP